MVEWVSGRLAFWIVASSALLPACLDSPNGGDGHGGPVQLLANPDFEEEATGWMADGGVEIGTTDELALPASQAGPIVAVLGRQDNQMDRLYQDVVVPDSTRTLELSGIRCYDTAEGFGMVYDRFTVVLESSGGDTEVLVEDSNLDATVAPCDWFQFGKATEGHAGEEIRIVMEAVTDNATRTSFAIDGLALTASP
jgi:hypothetical protein